ncbi:MAG: ATP-binding protein [Candidatus Omnitrophota bacterium]
MNINSIRFKASILYSGLLAFILSVFSAVIYLDVRNILYKNLDEELKIKAVETTNILYAYERIQYSSRHPVAQMLEMLKRQELGINQKMIIDDLWRSQVEALNLKDDFIHLTDGRGREVLSSNNFRDEIYALFKEQLPATGRQVVYKTLKNEKYRLRAIAMPVMFSNVQLYLQIGTSLRSTDIVLKNISLFMIGAVIVLLLLTSFVGAIFADSALRPVKEVSDLADSITHKSLSGRITGKKTDEEMEHLVNSFNGLIGRLEKSFGHINEFSSHAAHELKTPLAIIRGEIELALEGEKDPGRYREVLQGCLEETDRLIKVIKDLLLLAKLDYKPEVFSFEDLELTGFLKEIHEQSKILAEQKEITAGLVLPEGRAVVSADKVHLRRLFHNIIHNAIKFTPPGKTISINARIQDKKYLVDVTDTGEGISEENLLKIFDKFFRVHKDDEKSDPGTGLGLSIALSIARAHNGDITVQSQPGAGTTFTIILPVKEIILPG